MTTLYSILFWGYMLLSAPLFFVGAVAIKLLTLPFDRNGRLLHLYTCFWASQYAYVNPMWTVRVTGRRRGLVGGPCVYVSNHQSVGDVVVLFTTYLPFKWLSKASMFRVPFIGWNMWLNGYVSVVRGDRDSGRAAQAAALRWLERGVPMMYFPEGTRSPEGEIQPFKMGAFELALAGGCPVVPIVLEGTRECVPKHSWRLREKARVEIRVLEPIATLGHASAAELAAHVRGVMIDALAGLRTERSAR